MTSRIASTILILIILIGGGVLIYRFFKGPSATNVKTLTITKDNKFSPTTLKLANNEVLQIKNESNTNHTVKKSSDKSTLADIDAGTTTRSLNLDSNSTVGLYLADNTNTKMTITVGTPKTVANQPSTQPSSTTPVQATNTTPLPNTGPGDNVIFLAMAGLGAVLYPLTNFYWKKFVAAKRFKSTRRV